MYTYPKSHGNVIKCIGYFEDNLHLYNIESFSSGIGVLAAYSSPLLCSSRRFYQFFDMVLLNHIPRCFIFIVAIRRPPSATLYCLDFCWYIGNVFFLIICFVTFLSEFLLVLFEFSWETSRSTQKSFLLLCL